MVTLETLEGHEIDLEFEGFSISECWAEQEFFVAFDDIQEGSELLLRSEIEELLAGIDPNIKLLDRDSVGVYCTFTVADQQFCLYVCADDVYNGNWTQAEIALNKINPTGSNVDWILEECFNALESEEKFCETGSGFLLSADFAKTVINMFARINLGCNG